MLPLLVTCALTALVEIPEDPAGDLPPPPAAETAPAPVTPPRARPDAPAKPAPPADNEDAEPSVKASGLGIGIGAGVGSVLLGGIPGLLCGWVPVLGIPITCFGATIGTGAGGVIATVIADGDLDDNILWIGAGAGIAGVVSALFATAGTVLVYGASASATQTNDGVLLAILGASALSFAGAAGGGIAAGALLAFNPPDAHVDEPPRKPRAPRDRDDDTGEDALDALYTSQPMAF